MIGFCRIENALILGAVFLLVFAVSFEAGARQVVDRVVAVVNDDVIRLRELNKALDPVRERLESKALSGEEMREELYNAREKILEEMINEKLADQEIREADIQVEQSEVDAAIERIKEGNQYTDEELRQALQMQGMNMEKYRSEIKQQILRRRLVDRKVKSNIVITDEDIRRYYEDNPEKFGGEIKYELRNILMRYPRTDDEEARQEVFARMNLIVEQLEEGASFKQLAKDFSEAPNASDGGKLGQFALEDLSQNIRSVIGDLEKSEFSEIVETEQGFQIFYVEDIATTPPKPLEAVSDQIGNTLHEQRVNEKYSEWIESLREEAHIRIIR